MDFVPLIISFISGIVGGNVAGAAAPDKSLGTAGNTVTGLIGGALGGYILQAIEMLNKTGLVPAATDAAAAQGLDIGTILANVGSGGIGGAAIMLIIGFINNAMRK